MGEVFTALLVLLILLLATVRCWVQWNYRRVISTASKLPLLAPTWPILGNIPILLQGHVGFSDTIFKLLQQAGERKVKKNFTFWFGPYPYVVIGDGKDIETVLSSKKCQKTFHYEFLKVLFGNGLLIASDDVQKTTRRHINPIFTPRNMESFIQELNASGRNLANAMSKHVGRGLVDVQHTVFSPSFKSIGDLLLGRNILPEEGTAVFEQILKVSMSIGTLIASRFRRFWLWPDRMFNIFHKKDIDSALDIWREFSERPLEIITKKKTLDTGSSGNETTPPEGNDPVSYITLPEVYESLKRNHPQFTNQDMQYELFTLMETGSHSTKGLIASLFLALAAHPDIQERLYQEVVSVVGTEDNDVTIEDFKRMPYLEQVLKETLRKFSVVPLVTRKSNEDLQLSDITVPAGLIMIISFITQHYDSEVFPDPYDFNPERFSSENMTKMKKHNFMPFAAGSRMCIGTVYTMIFAKVMAVHVIRKFKLSTSVDVSKLKYSWSITKLSVDGYHLELHSRDPTKRE